MPATTLAADPYPTTNGTWNVRAGVGTSIDNPALWMDEANWVDGKIPDGPELALADFRVGTSTDVIWVKLPDDRPITVQKLLFAKGAARIRFFGGQGFNFNRTTGPTYIQLVKDKTSQDIQAYAATTPGENAPIFFTPVHCAKNMVYLNNIALAGPVSFGFSNKNQLYFQWFNIYRADRYASCGGDTRVILPNLTRVTAGELAVTAPQNNEAHTGSWVATKDSKIFRYASGKTGTELAVGQYVHADGVIPEGAYVEYIYDDNHIGLSQAALADSADATAGTSIAFDRCYYKLTQSIENWAFANEGNLWSTVGILRRDEENVCTFDIKNITDGKIQKFWINSAASKIREFPAPGIVELRNASAIGAKELRFAGASYLRLSGDSLAANTVSNWCFNTGECFGTIDVPADCKAQVYAKKMFRTCPFDKMGEGELTIHSSLASTKQDQSDQHGKVSVLEGSLVFAPTQNTTMETLAIYDGATFALAGTSTVTVKTVNVRAGGTFVWPTNATLSANSFVVTTGSSIRFEMAVKDDGSVDPYSITDAKYNLANGGEIRLTGDVKKIAAGRHRLVSSSTIGDLGGWTLTGYEGPRKLTLAKDAEGLYLDVKVPGLVLFLK